MASYKIIGKRFLRKYSEAAASPVYSANVEAQKIVQELCSIPWKATEIKDARMTYHTEEKIGESGKSGLDLNVDIRDEFDAALFCADHKAGQHRAFANAAVYRYSLPDSAVGVSLTSLALNVTSDPYNSRGARIHVFTNSTGEIPMSCHAIRGEDDSGEVIEDGTTLAAFAPRTAQTVSGTEYWYPTTATGTITPTEGLTLGKYLFVTVVMESYSTVRGNWIEGCSFIENLVTIETSTAITGWTDGSTQDARGNHVSKVSQYIKSTSEYIPVTKSEIFRVNGVIHSCVSNLKESGGTSYAGFYSVIVANGDFSDGSSADIPGWIVYDVVNSRKVIFPDDSFSDLVDCMRLAGVDFAGASGCRLNNYDAAISGSESCIFFKYGTGAYEIQVKFRYDYETGDVSNIEFGSARLVNSQIGYGKIERYIPLENYIAASEDGKFGGSVNSISRNYHIITSRVNDSSTSANYDFSVAVTTNGYINLAAMLGNETIEGVLYNRIFVSGEFTRINGVEVNYAAIIKIERKSTEAYYKDPTGKIIIENAGIQSVNFDDVTGLKLIPVQTATVVDESNTQAYVAVGNFVKVNNEDLGAVVCIASIYGRLQLYPMSQYYVGNVLPDGRHSIFSNIMYRYMSVYGLCVDEE